MAGVMMEGDEGREVSNAQVPTIGGVDGVPATAPVVASAHLNDAQQQNGVQYPETPGIAVTDQPYPAGTRMTDSTPGDTVN